MGTSINIHVGLVVNFKALPFDLSDWMEDNDEDNVLGFVDDNSIVYESFLVLIDNISLDDWENMGFQSLESFKNSHTLEKFKATKTYKNLIKDFGEDNFTIEFGTMKSAS